MKRIAALFMSIVLIFSMSFGAFAVSDKSGNPNGSGSQKTEQNRFRVELNEQRKAISQQRAELQAQKEQLEAQYQKLIDSGDTSAAQDTLDSIKQIDEQIGALQTQARQIVRERFMVAKTMYTEQELAQFNSVSDLIKQMYKDADVLSAGCVVANGNVIKFDTPPYIKGGRTLIPVRAITEGLGAQVKWNPDDNTVTITKDDKTVIITLGSNIALVDGVEVEIDAPAQMTSNRTYVPLRFLAEVFGFDVNWDGEDQAIDVENSDDN